MKYPHHLKLLIESLKKLPGVGSRTAERFAFEMLAWSADDLKKISRLLGELKNAVRFCPACGCLIEETDCQFCQEQRLKEKKVCVVSSFKSVLAIDSTGLFKGAYHVLNHLLSPLRGQGPDTLGIERLLERIETLQFQEVVLAFDSTLEGDATALYLKRELESTGVKVLRLATGIPMGSSLDLIDQATLSKALMGRSQV
ncbi:recombination mediator RecR [Estrella lausannensis]|uniref:Recombination protein RecR n=1 Tax=Estrella lausannensis TaxID=483423 RepID=A0A0H5DSU3_9BACT|nr:recombination mediator RecR [Estrella lausannensis]CRX39398.1 Recombination protein recR [Estrella lausannensis]